MKIIEWLLQGDPVIGSLCQKYLLDQAVDFHETGYLKRYLSLYQPEKKGWGYGLYSPKWISDHYTLLECKEMEINPAHPAYQTSVIQLLDSFWYQGRARKGKGRHFDVCVTAMLLDMAAYGRIEHPSIHEMVDYLILVVQPDGGWNCSWDAKPA